MASIANVKDGDMLKVSIGGGTFYALAEGAPYEEGGQRYVNFNARAVCPNTGLGYTRARPREVVTVYRKLGRSRG